MRTNKSRNKNSNGVKGLMQRVNRALTEFGIEHFDDDCDYDQRVKLPEWQLARLKRRYEERKKRSGENGVSADQP